MNNKQVIWIDTKEDKKLANDDSTNDLIYKEKEVLPPVVVHKEKQPAKSIMKVQIDPFFAECFPPPV